MAAHNGNPKDVVNALRNLLTTLQDTASYPLALDNKLAEYVFFPLSHVLKEKQKLPVAALELTLKCLAILLQTGWRAKVDPSLSRQLLILLPVLISGSPQGQTTPSAVSEELQAAGLRCLAELFTTYGQNEQGQKALTAADSIPPLGHAIVVVIEGVTGGSSNDVQLAAAQALRAACSSLKDREALASFLPGIVSGLAKVLTPATKQRRSYDLLCLSLEILSFLFKAVLGDQHTKSLPSSEQATVEPEQKLTQAWLKATTAQVKLALANIIRVRQHVRAEVRRALLHLCLTVLEDCRESLKDSATMMIETMIVLCRSDEDGGLKSTIRQVLMADTRFAELLRSSIHSWVVSLPRVMQSPDDSAKRRLVHQISTGYELLAEQGLDLDIVDRAVASNLRDGISTTILDQSKLKEIAPATGFNTSLDLTLPAGSGPSVDFEPIFYENSAQREIVNDLRDLVKHVSASKSSMTAAGELVHSLQFSKGAPQLASFWVALQLLKFSSESEAPMIDFLDFGDSAVGPREELSEEMYSYSLDVLQDRSMDSQSDWRLQAMALETVAFQAQTLKEDFRIELVDALYPVVHLVGSSIPQLRSHAITCLNIVAASCHYKDVGSLIVENVDYLVNAVALKLNTFDISPQAPQVLLMMIKLSGPSLLPYLDDLVGSVFAALESFHGYPKLVELLFSVLKGIAEEGVKTPQLAITQGEDIYKTKEASHTTTLNDIISNLKDLQTREAKPDEPPGDDTDTTELTPRRPWKDVEKATNNPLISELDDEEEEEAEPQTPNPTTDTTDAPPPPPAPRTYALLLRISALTQHHLTAPSAPLRTSLLALLHTTLPALARHHDSFLPLVNTLWPVLVPRLDDPEPYVVADACAVMATMCRCGGDFMRGRVEGVWGVLVGLWRRGGGGGTSTMPGGRRSSSSLVVLEGGGGGKSGQVQPVYTAAPTRIIREALVGLFVAVVEAVQVDEAAFEEVVEVLGREVVVGRREVREVFERRNADAVWLAERRWEREEWVGMVWPGRWEGREFASVGVVG